MEESTDLISNVTDKPSVNENITEELENSEELNRNQVEIVDEVKNPKEQVILGKKEKKEIKKSLPQENLEESENSERDLDKSNTLENEEAKINKELHKNQSKTNISEKITAKEDPKDLKNSGSQENSRKIITIDTQTVETSLSQENSSNSGESSELQMNSKVKNLNNAEQVSDQELKTRFLDSGFQMGVLQYSQMNDKSNCLTNINNQLKIRNNALQLKYTKCFNNMVTLKQDNNKLKQDNNNLNQENDSLTQSNNNLKQDNDNLKQSNNNLKQVNDKYKQDNNKYKEDYDKLKQDNNKYKEDYDKLKQDNNKYKEDYDKLKQRADNLKQANDRGKQDYTNLKQYADNLKRSNRNLKQSNNNLKQVNDKYKQDNDNLKQDNNNLKQDNDKYKQDNDKLKQDSENLNQENNKLKQDNGDLKQDNKNLKNMNIGLIKAKSVRSCLIATLSDRVEYLEKLQERLEEEMKKANSKILSLNKHSRRNSVAVQTSDIVIENIELSAPTQYRNSYDNSFRL